MAQEPVEFGEALEAYMDQEKMYHFESTSGVRNINRIARTLGYADGLEEMLADNPFLQQALVEALMNYDDSMGEWTKELVANTYAHADKE